jgi:hypothetical protein
MSTKVFDNANRHRYYGLRIGDIVDARGISGIPIYKNVEVHEYSGFDNNRVVLKLASGNTCDWVAEWCTIITKVEDRNKKPYNNSQIIDKLAKELSKNISGNDNIDALCYFGSLGLMTCRELVTAFYNDIKKEILNEYKKV